VNKRLLLLALGLLLPLFSCAEREKERVAIPPRSNLSKKPWNHQQRGEGSGLFGGAIQAR
jgi:hypothetical protein